MGAIKKRGESVALRIWRCMPSLAKVHDLSLAFVVRASLKPQARAVHAMPLCTVRAYSACMIDGELALPGPQFVALLSPFDALHDEFSVSTDQVP